MYVHLMDELKSNNIRLFCWLFFSILLMTKECEFEIVKASRYVTITHAIANLSNSIILPILFDG